MGTNVSASILKTEEVGSFETLVRIYQTTRYHIPQYPNLIIILSITLYCCGNNVLRNVCGSKTEGSINIWSTISQSFGNCGPLHSGPSSYHKIPLSPKVHVIVAFSANVRMKVKFAINHFSSIHQFKAIIHHMF
jgi:hypothetical protein